MLGVHLLNAALDFKLNQFAISPRDLTSVWTIYSAPFLHVNAYHLFNNLLGIIIFGGLYLVHPIKRFVQSGFIIITLTGLMVWLFGRNALHLGASGWVFGLWGLCIATAWYERKFMNIIVAAIVVIFYGGLIFGIFPRDPKISFESHFFGVVAGIICAYINGRRG